MKKTNKIRASLEEHEGLKVKSILIKFKIQCKYLLTNRAVFLLVSGLPFLAWIKYLSENLRSKPRTGVDEN